MPCPSRDDDVATDHRLALHLDSRPIDEMRAAMPGKNARLRKGLLVLVGCGVGEGALEANQLRPVDRQSRRAHAPALHALTPIHQLRDTHEHFLGITAALLTGPAEGT